jgi:hypothetical protein
MKYLFLFILSLVSLTSFGSTGSLFTYDVAKVEQSFSKVNEVEKIVLQNDQTDLNQVILSHKELITAANLNTDVKHLSASDWQLDWGSVAIGAAGCLVLQGIGCLIFYAALLNSYPY